MLPQTPPMDFWHGFAVMTVVHLLAAASPGPDFAYVTRQSRVHGRKDLDIRGLRSSARAAPAGMLVRDLPASPLRQIAGGFPCNAFKPKAPIYPLALFTVVLSPKLPLPTLLVYGAWTMLLQWHGSHCSRRGTGARVLAPPWWPFVCVAWRLRTLERA